MVSGAGYQVPEQVSGAGYQVSGVGRNSFSYEGTCAVADDFFYRHLAPGTRHLAPDTLTPGTFI